MKAEGKMEVEMEMEEVAVGEELETWEVSRPPEMTEGAAVEELQ